MHILNIYSYICRVQLIIPKGERTTTDLPLQMSGFLDGCQDVRMSGYMYIYSRYVYYMYVIHINAYICMYIKTCIYICVTYMCIYITYMHVYYLYNYTCIYIYIYIYICVGVYILYNSQVKASQKQLYEVGENGFRTQDH